MNIRITIAIIIFFASALAVWKFSGASKTEGAKADNLSLSNQSLAENENVVSDSTKAEIIIEIYKTLGPEDDAVSDDGSLYLMISKNVFSKLPHRINKITLKIVNSKEVTKDFHKNYVVFEGWAQSGKLVVVRETANFWDGNTGGCVRRLTKVQDNWIQSKPECFADAS